jgi:alcohol dehydrogenase
MLSSLGGNSSDLTIPLGPFLAGLGDHTLVTTLCPGGKERMRRLMETISVGRVDTRPLVRHRFNLDQWSRLMTSSQLTRWRIENRYYALDFCF